MKECPLVLKGATATVRFYCDRFVVEIQAREAPEEEEVWRRASRSSSPVDAAPRRSPRRLLGLLRVIARPLLARSRGAAPWGCAVPISRLGAM